MTRDICVIANEIRKDWKNITPAARAYLDAMDDLAYLNEFHGLDSAEDIVNRFLSNASSWRGDKAKEIKAELKKMLKDLD